MRGRSHLWIGPLLVAAATLLLHAPGLGWGLPSRYGWAPDELLPEIILEGLARGFSGDWTSKYPPFHQALLGLLYLPVLHAHGLHASGPIPGDVYHTLFLIGRTLSLLMAAGVAALVYDCGRRLLDRRGALFAALLTATLLPFGFYAKLGNLDVPYLFWALVSLRFALRALDRPGAFDLSAFGVAAVLAVATKDQAYGLYALGAPLLILARARRRASGTWRPGPFGRALFGRDLALATLAAGAAFVVAFRLPGNWGGFLEHVRIITGPASEDFQLFPATLAGQAALAHHSAAQLAFVLGLPALAVCVLGVGSVSARLLGLLAPPQGREPGRPDDRLLLGLLVPTLSYYATFIAVVLYSYDRFMLPLGVVLSFFGGRVLSEATAWPGWQGRVGRLVALVVVAYGLARAASLDALMLNDTRYAAERWLNAHAGAEDHVAGVGTLPRLPRLDGRRWSLLPPSADALTAARPDWVVINVDSARSLRPGGAKARFYGRLRGGALAYRRVWGERWSAPWLVFDAERLSRGAYGPVLSNLEVVNPEIEVYRRAD
jgi:hypothetical protein